ncbi:beta-carotene 15,15'-monooxygenase [Chryseobacterium indologenes]|uniref:DUF4153 domain-containing protein n=1 Tax=Chryseobacterium indologenes TaxID=253 RepID=UPI000BFB2A8D|nr:DUF4173 domain-containing protein [Chryseobacterium indologenes]ATN07831.1 beta-carotene 15,15'-monooxygenase [Chryseobacterium indologenes]AYY83432.1 DUF4173 domain-containing protein [Chryseobacterium indologenes]TLX24491.1 DUF4173 domain-containing protein [Chryseobacterium indologenes]UDQ53996.1 DUF4173 domain-containing protein [Chryseobacterium indologenes]
MKTHQYILITAILFVILFYEQEPGLNLGILAIVYTVLTLFRTSEKNRTRAFLILFVTSILSAVAFAWYGDFPSFLAVVSSLLLLAYRSKNRKMKILFLLPVFIVNCCTSFCRFFSFDQWMPKRNVSGLWQKTLAFILIPLILVSVFFGIYSAGSDHFAALFTDYELDINLWQLFCLSVLGFFIAFNYWNYAVEKLIYKNHHFLDNDFKKDALIPKATYSFLDLDSERMSGVISFLLLNILLVFFIITYNYEQFYETSKTPVQLSEETHERVNAVIMSIVMAILVIMFYFKSGFNFDPKSGLMKVLAKFWIFLNAVLVLSAAVKNYEYVVQYALTYKRLGVFAFLMLALVGLALTYIKIQKRKRNAFLFNTMTWYLYGTILVCSYVNWGGFITSQNMKRKDFAVNYHFISINFSEKDLLKYADEKHDQKLKKQILDKIRNERSKTFLSKIIYYQTIK